MRRTLIVLVLLGGACKKVSPNPDPSRTGSGSAQPAPAADDRAMPGATPDQIIARFFERETISAISVRYVRSDGRLDPKLGEVNMRHIYPTDKRGPEAARPLGAPIEWNQKTVFAGFTTWDATGNVKKRDTGYGDDQALAVKPACTVTQLWQKALAGGAPANALAVIWLEVGANGRPQHWVFTITDAPRKVFFRLEVPDDCVATAEAAP